MDAGSSRNMGFTLSPGMGHIYVMQRWSTTLCVLVASVVPSTRADLWHLHMGHLNFQDICKLKSKAMWIAFVGEPCFCKTCVMANMRRTLFQSTGEMTVDPK